MPVRLWKPGHGQAHRRLAPLTETERGWLKDLVTCLLSLKDFGLSAQARKRRQHITAWRLLAAEVAALLPPPEPRE